MGAIIMPKCRFIGSVGAILLLSMPAAPAAASDEGWATASDVVRAGLVAAAVGAPAVDGDGAGAVQGAGSVAAAYLVAEALKQTFPATRPDGSDNRSFPSAHSATAFAAAATISERQGETAGLLAHAAAAFVAVARVEARKHRWGDVIVGAAVGELSGRLLTNRHDRSVAILPWADTSGGGIAIAARF